MTKDQISPEILQGDLFMFKETSSEAYCLCFEDEDIAAYYDDKKLYFHEDHEGFAKKMYGKETFQKFFSDYPQVQLYGCFEEGNFVVCDVVLKLADNEYFMQHFEMYHHVLAQYGIHYRAPICKFCNPETPEYVHMIMDVGVWHLKNYGKQKHESWTINPIEKK